MEPAIVVTIKNEAGDEQRHFDQACVRLGRSPDNDIVFDNEAEISSHHAELRLEDDKLIVYDMGAKNGVYLNGKRIEDSAVVSQRVELRLGPHGPQMHCHGLHPDGSTMLVASPDLLEDAPKQGIGAETLEIALKDVKRSAQRRLYVVIVLLLGISAVIAYAIFNKFNYQEDVIATQQHQAQMQQQQTQEQITALLQEIDERDRKVREAIAKSELSEEDRYELIKDAEAQLRKLEQRLVNIQSNVQQHENKNWVRIHNEIKSSVFLCVAINPDTGSVGIGTAFLIDDKGILATNAHVVQLLRAMSERYVIQNETGKLFKIKRTAHNPLFVTLNSADVGIIELEIEDHTTLPQALTFAQDQELFELQVGSRLGTLGFPGELQSQYLDKSSEEEFPGAVATFKQGWIGRITDYKGKIQDRSKNVLIQHSASLSGGTSGSPLFNEEGKVVAISSSSMTSSFKVGSLRSKQVLSAAQIAFAVRADEIRRFMTKAKLQTLP